MRRLAEIRIQQGKVQQSRFLHDYPVATPLACSLQPTAMFPDRPEVSGQELVCKQGRTYERMQLVNPIAHADAGIYRAPCAWLVWVVVLRHLRLVEPAVDLVDPACHDPLVLRLCVVLGKGRPELRAVELPRPLPVIVEGGVDRPVDLVVLEVMPARSSSGKLVVKRLFHVTLQLRHLFRRILLRKPLAVYRLRP